MCRPLHRWVGCNQGLACLQTVIITGIRASLRRHAHQLTVFTARPVKRDVRVNERCLDSGRGGVGGSEGVGRIWRVHTHTRAHARTHARTHTHTPHCIVRASIAILLQVSGVLSFCSKDQQSNFVCVCERELSIYITS